MLRMKRGDFIIIAIVLLLSSSIYGVKWFKIRSDGFKVKTNLTL
ncbi:hypothetical protein [Paenibacillus wynnii]|nr:hypothetical protein [Paenibacillus wynnii]MDQ0193787.1 hypothetical protein [Paenibacillus wynnii]